MEGTPNRNEAAIHDVSWVGNVTPYLFIWLFWSS